MKPKTLVLMVVAVTCGLGASYMTSRLLAERNSDDSPQTAVLVAKQSYNIGVTLKVPQDMFEEKLYKQGEEPRDAVTKIEDLKGKVLKRGLRHGDFIRAEDLLDQKDQATAFAVNLPSGYRAVGLRVNPESCAGGFANLPHSRVDIIQTVRRGDDKTSYAQIILENVLVLAADQATNRNESGQAMLANVVTVALAPEDAMKLQLAREMGSLSLALRKFNDHAKSPIEKVTAEDVKNNTAKSGDSTDLNGSENPENSKPAPVVALPNLPKLDPDAAKPAVKAEEPVVPAGTAHLLVIVEGDKSRPINFMLDKQGRVLNQDVARSDVNARPPQLQPQVDRGNNEE